MVRLPSLFANNHKDPLPRRQPLFPSPHPCRRPCPAMVMIIALSPLQPPQMLIGPQRKRNNNNKNQTKHPRTMVVMVPWDPYHACPLCLFYARPCLRLPNEYYDKRGLLIALRNAAINPAPTTTTTLPQQEPNNGEEEQLFTTTRTTTRTTMTTATTRIRYIRPLRNNGPING